MLLTIDEHGSKIARNSIFDCHLSPVGRQMAIKNSVSNDFLSTLIDSINVCDCCPSGVLCVGKGLKLNGNLNSKINYSVLSFGKNRLIYFSRR